MLLADHRGARALVATSVTCMLLLPGSALAGSSKKAHSAAARTATFKHSVNGSGVYTASISIRRPKTRANKVTLRVENAKSRKLTIRPSRTSKTMKVTVDAAVNDGALTLTAVGNVAKPKVSVELRKKPSTSA